MSADARYQVGVADSIRATAIGSDAELDRRELEAGGLRVSYFTDGELAEGSATVAECDALVVARHPISAEALGRLPRLRHICRWGAGVDHIDIDACDRDGVVVTTTRGSTQAVASAALAALLALAHQLPTKDRMVREARWEDRRTVRGPGLHGRTVGVIGLGAIGRQFIELIRPFAVDILVLDRASDAPVAREIGASPASFEHLLARSDAVILLCSLTDTTRGLIDATALSLMKPTAYLVNLARGEICVQADLAAALGDGRIAGAALDVFESEPLSIDDPLTRLGNVILSPHSLANTEQGYQASRREVLDTVLDLALHRPLRTRVVNPASLNHPRWSSRISLATDEPAAR